MKILGIGDMHWGEQNNSPEFNRRNHELLEWAVDVARERGVDKIVQFGDWFHQRSKIDVATMNASTKAARMLSEQFGKENVWILLGNHCLYYLNRLDVHSLKTVEHLVTVIDEPTPIEDTGVLVVPWITDEAMWEKVWKASDKYSYLFSHLELNGFMVNDAYEMEHGFSPKLLNGYKRVLSGHYHSPQTKGNITYLGTPMPITMNEANESHGVYVFDTETNDLEFIEYHGFKVLSVSYEEYQEIKDDLDPATTYIRVEFPEDLEDETLITEVQEDMKARDFHQYKVKHTNTKAKKLLEADTTEVKEVENIDEVVIGFLTDSTEIKGINKPLMNRLYTRAIANCKEAK